MQEADAFWAGAAAGILGGAVTGALALVGTLVASRLETRRQLARERRAAYADLVAGMERLNLLIFLVTDTPRFGVDADQMRDEFIEFQRLLSAAHAVASPRVLGLVQRIDSTIGAILSYAVLPDEVRKALEDPMQDLVNKVRRVFQEEVRYELEVGEAGVLERWRKRQEDPSGRLIAETQAVVDEFKARAEADANEAE